MLPLPMAEKMRRDAEEMRSFYISVGLSEETTERALRTRFNSPDESGSGHRKIAPKPRGRHVRK